MSKSQASLTLLLLVTLLQMKKLSSLRFADPNPNLAFNKTTYQSTTAPIACCNASNAADGKADGNFDHCSCTHTVNEAQPAWWAVDLGVAVTVAEVVITTRSDCCSERLRDFDIGVMDISPAVKTPRLLNSSEYTIIAHYTGSFLGQVSIAPSIAKMARYLFIRQTVLDPLTLCEVQVYSSYHNNVALNEPTFQSSTAVDPCSNASKAVDGIRDGSYDHCSCTHTDNEAQAWWAVDLATEATVYMVSITSRDDCCTEWLRDFDIGMTNVSPSVTTPRLLDVSQYSIIAHYPGTPYGTVDIHCRIDATGRYLFIRQTVFAPLNLCEVRVYTV